MKKYTSVSLKSNLLEALKRSGYPHVSMASRINNLIWDYLTEKNGASGRDNLLTLVQRDDDLGLL